jgi:hypothetical protein
MSRDVAQIGARVVAAIRGAGIAQEVVRAARIAAQDADAGASIWLRAAARLDLGGEVERVVELLESAGAAPAQIERMHDLLVTP